MLFKIEKKQTKGTYPRSSSTTVRPLDELNLVYEKYSREERLQGSPERVAINLVFVHGTSMSKAVWKYHIRRLYKYNAKNWVLKDVLALDEAGHGDSGFLNKGKLGGESDWNDSAKDVNEVVKHEQRTSGDFKVGKWEKNIVIGHSLGAYHSILASFFEPNIYEEVIAFEPVMYISWEGADHFQMLIEKWANLVMDQFEDMELYENYFKMAFRFVHPEIVQDFLREEKVTVVDENNEEKICTKTSGFHQVATFASSLKYVPFGMHNLSQLQTPVTHVIGTKAKWNPPQSIPYIRNSIPKGLVTPVDLENGRHLCCFEMPEETLSVIVESVQRRVDALYSKNAANDKYLADVGVENVSHDQQSRLFDLYKKDFDSYQRKKNKL